MRAKLIQQLGAPGREIWLAGPLALLCATMMTIDPGPLDEWEEAARAQVGAVKHWVALDTRGAAGRREIHTETYRAPWHSRLGESNNGTHNMMPGMKTAATTRNHRGTGLDAARQPPRSTGRRSSLAARRRDQKKSAATRCAAPVPPPLHSLPIYHLARLSGRPGLLSWPLFFQSFSRGAPFQPSGMDGWMGGCNGQPRP